MGKRTKDWNRDNGKGVIRVPDELGPIMNKVMMQLQFLTISGKNKIQTCADITKICEDFFSEMYEHKAADIALMTPINSPGFFTSDELGMLVAGLNAKIKKT